MTAETKGRRSKSAPLVPASLSPNYLPIRSRMTRKGWNAKWVFNALGDKGGDGDAVAIERMMANDKSGAAIDYLTNTKVMGASPRLCSDAETFF